MIYEMRIYTLKPGAISQYVENWTGAIEERQKLSRMVGFFTCEIGDLNKCMHIWEYKSAGHREEVRSQYSTLKNWPPKGGEAIQKMASKFMTTPPFRPEPRTGSLGNVYEFRTYTFMPNKIPVAVKGWTEHVAEREALSPLAACFITETGPLNEFIHVWPYRDLNDRAEKRAESQSLKNWPVPGYREFILRQNSEIWIPSSFSQMH